MKDLLEKEEEGEIFNGYHKLVNMGKKHKEFM